MYLQKVFLFHTVFVDRKNVGEFHSKRADLLVLNQIRDVCGFKAIVSIVNLKIRFKGIKVIKGI